MRFIHGILDKQLYYCCFSILFLLRNLVGELVMLRIVIAEGILSRLNKVVLSCLVQLSSTCFHPGGGVCYKVWLRQKERPFLLLQYTVEWGNLLFQLCQRTAAKRLTLKKGSS